MRRRKLIPGPRGAVVRPALRMARAQLAGRGARVALLRYGSETDPAPYATAKCRQRSPKFRSSQRQILSSASKIAHIRHAVTTSMPANGWEPQCWPGSRSKRYRDAISERPSCSRPRIQRLRAARRDLGADSCQATATTGFQPRARRPRSTAGPAEAPKNRDGAGNRGIATTPVVAAAREEAHAIAVSADLEAIAIVSDLADPARTGRRLGGTVRGAGWDEGSGERHARDVTGAPLLHRVPPV